MPDVRVVLSHQLGKAEALTRVRALLTNVKREHEGQIRDLREQWNANGARFSFSAMGFSVSGELAVSDREVIVTGKLPLAAILLKSRIEDAIRTEASELLV